MKKLIAFCCGLVATSRVFAVVQSPIDCQLFFDGTNTVQIAWNAYPGKSYVLQSTTNLLGSWSNGPTLVAITNAFTNTFSATARAQFFKIVKLDTEGPALLETTPNHGSIAVGWQSSVSARLTDLNGINTNSLSFQLGTNVPVTLADARLSFANGQLTYTPATNEFLGDYAAFVTNRLIAADTLGNWSTNDWSFQLAFQPVASTNILFIGGGGAKSSRGPVGPNGPQDACDLTLIATNGDYFTFSYTGPSPCLATGMHLVNTNLATGYTRTVVSFTNDPSSNTVVALTRPTKLAELLQQGSLQGATFTELTGSSPQPKGALTLGLSFHYNYNLEQVLYEDGDLVIGLLPSSELDLNAAFDIGANFDWFKLTSFEAVFSGSADFTLEAYAYASSAYDDTNETALIEPIHKFYGAMIGPVPVWVELVFEINAGYELHLAGSAGYTNGFNAVKQIKMGRRWDTTQGWTTIWDNPELGFSLLGPKWQVEASGNLQVWLQPKVTAYAYSVAGAWADLKPYAELDGRLQLNPYEFELSLYAGLTSTLGLDLRGWDDSWGELPNVTFDLIPRTLLWEHNSAATAPEIASQPQPQAVSPGATATFNVEAGGTGPFSYRWQKNGLYLTDDGRIAGTRGSTLRIANAQTSDAGGYRVVVSNPNGSVTSQSALLTVFYSGSVPSGMVLIPADSFTMGSPIEEQDRYSDEGPQTAVTLTKGFYVGKYLVTQREYQAVMGSNPSYFTGETNRPVEQVNWFDATNYCTQLTRQEQAAGRLPASWVYRLPTEAEWEYACRAGTTTRFSYGDDPSYTLLGNYAWYYGNSGGITHPVGAKLPNPWGLYDMHGNLWEWCLDWLGTYPGGSVTNPTGPASGSLRVIRGGGWNGAPRLFRSASRAYNAAPSYRGYNIGFRVVLAPCQP